VNQFPAENTRLQDFAYNISKFSGEMSLDLSNGRERLPPIPTSSYKPLVLGPRHHFRSARQRSHCSCFTKRPLACWTYFLRSFSKKNIANKVSIQYNTVQYNVLVLSLRKHACRLCISQCQWIYGITVMSKKHS